MAINFKRTQILPSLRSKDSQSADTVYWNRLDVSTVFCELKGLWDWTCLVDLVGRRVQKSGGGLQ